MAGLTRLQDLLSDVSLLINELHVKGFMSKKYAPLAIAYDFDGTLAAGNMQEYDFIPALKMTSAEFWEEVKNLAANQEADEILAYMHLMLEKAKATHVPVRRSDFQNFGASIELFPGVLDWFDRIDQYGRSKGCKIEHFIISSGIREMIEGTKIRSKFKKIYGSGFMFDHNGVAHWPAVAMNYTTKTQFLFRINKGSLDVHDNSVINRFIPKEDRAVPFENIIFIGDGITDVPCMRLVKDQGGHAIAVYNSRKKGAKEVATKLVEEGRASLTVPANYTADSAIERAVFAMIDKVSATERIGRPTRQKPTLIPAINPLQDLTE
ncbi:phosphoserine phosphatase [Variovorax boronicumulans]|uniref:haloacid dehalogenase-like hydrolase n=1 Tax=Variovorax boronicumulans TaxID=436515 RepID=UPI00278B4B83|nr:haloacid dehalogenase-like hydrolase [Variovorax boronicumulans]MDP9989795.1 phosphoserine phosphatase [Variovorax boronicumulans]MDQ0005691.1 phosphoserine phosphatase [Variovorax boronicumulans]